MPDIGQIPLPSDEADLIQLANGNLLRVWDTKDDTSAGSPPGHDIIGQILSPLGAPIGGTFRVNGGFNGDSEDKVEVAALDDGGFVAVFRDAGDGIRLTHFNANGARLSQHTVALDPADPDIYLTDPEVAVNGAGTVVVTYNQWEGSTIYVDPETMFARTYDPQTQKMGGSPIPLYAAADFDADGTGGHLSDKPGLIALSDDRFLSVSYVGTTVSSVLSERVIGQLMNANGEQIGGEFTIEGTLNVFFTNPGASALGNSGGFVVAYTVGEGTNREIRAQIMTAEQTFRGLVVTRDEVIVTSATAHAQMGPAVAELADGTFVIVWLQNIAAAGPLDQDTLQGRIFAADGTAIGSQFEIARAEDGSRGVRDLEVEALADGRFAVTWTDVPDLADISDAGGDGFGISKAVILDPRDGANPGSQNGGTVIGTPGNDAINVAPSDLAIYGYDGADRFIFATQDADAGDLYDGGAGTDRLTILGAGLNDFRGADIRNFERVEFDFSPFPANDRTVRFDDTQFGELGLGEGRFGVVTFEGGPDGAGEMNAVTVEIFMSVEARFNMASWAFETWNVLPTQDYLIRLIGDDSDETLTGSSEADEIRGNAGGDVIRGGGGPDRLVGGTGRDQLFGDDGDDVLVVNAGDLTTASEVLDGGADRDTLEVRGVGSSRTWDLRPHDLRDLDGLRFGSIGSGTREVVLDRDAAGSGFAADTAVTGHGNTSDVIRIFHESPDLLDLSGWTFSNWGRGDVLEVTGGALFAAPDIPTAWTPAVGTTRMTFGPAGGVYSGGFGTDTAILPEGIGLYDIDFGTSEELTVLTHIGTGATFELRDVEVIEFADTTIPNNSPASIQVADQTLGIGEIQLFRDILQYTDPEGDDYEGYRVLDPGGDPNWWRTSGEVPLPVGQPAVSANAFSLALTGR